MTHDTTTDDATSSTESTDRRRLVRERYGSIAGGDADVDDCCAPACCEAPADTAAGDGARATDDRADCCEPTCCDDEVSGSDPSTDERGGRRRDAAARSRDLGYEESDLESVPDGSNLGLGCGNPVALANLEPGETVLDLGSGGGFDCFLAAREVGPTGRAIGVDMTPEMIERARENARESDLENAEFRLGEIEHLPVADGTVDAVVSNCVINLSPEKPRVYAEASRVLRPGGRLSVSDLVATEALPAEVREDEDLIGGCVGGAATVEDHRTWLEDAGFEDVDVVVDGEWDAEYDGEVLPIVSARIEARTPV